MGTRQKTFDCVEMKRKAQQELMREFEARKSEFTSYAQFLRATADESALAKSVRRRMARSAKLARP